MGNFTPKTPIQLQIRKIIFENHNGTDEKFTNDEILAMGQKGGRGGRLIAQMTAKRMANPEAAAYLQAQSSLERAAILMYLANKSQKERKSSIPGVRSQE